MTNRTVRVSAGVRAWIKIYIRVLRTWNDYHCAGLLPDERQAKGVQEQITINFTIFFRSCTKQNQKKDW